MASTGGAVNMLAPAAVEAPPTLAAAEVEETDQAAAADEPEEDAEAENAGGEDEASGGNEGDGFRFNEPTIGAFGQRLYDAVVGEVRKMIGEEGLDFLREVRSLLKDLRDLLQTARGQAAIRRHGKDTDKAIEDAETALKDLGGTMQAMEAEIHRQAPTAGMTLSVAT